MFRAAPANLVEGVQHGVCELALPREPLFDDRRDDRLDRRRQPPGFAAASADKVQANAALGSATELVEAVTAVVEALIDSPARVLSSGGIGRREQRQLAAVAPGQPVYRSVMMGRKP